jgi:transcriptional regulator with XRE-family HTH domain
MAYKGDFVFSDQAPKEMGNLIKKARTAAGMTQAALAQKLGYSSPQFCSNWERGAALPPIGTLSKIARATSTKYENFANVLKRDFDRVLKTHAK